LLLCEPPDFANAVAPDKWEFISGVRRRIADFAYFKLDNALGITSKANDWALQIGCLFSFLIKRS